MPEWNLPADVPLVLLPVRLETRFRGTTLCVRIFPDQLHVDTHEPKLTDAEVDAGKAYWQAYWTAADDLAESVAWDALADRFGVERGAWIARCVEPTNPAGRPTAPPAFPAVQGQNDPWTRAPLARALPTRWTVAGTPIGAEGQWFRRTGGTVTGPLAVGPTPGFDASTIDPAAPPFDPALHWLVDYEAAEAAGMGVQLPMPDTMTPAQFRGWKRLFVYGVQESASSADGAGTLAALLDAQYYTQGFSYLAQGTPTNNTPGAAAAPGRGDPAYRAAYRPRLAAAPPSAADANARVLARALGVNVAGAVARAAGAADREQAGARWMQTALWRVTLGYFLSQMLGTDVTEAQVSRVRRHVLDWVRPGGPLPALRIGRQPYGVLPVLATAAYQQREGTEFGPDPLGLGTLTFLQQLRTQLWAPSIDSVPRASDPQADTAVRILGMGAHAQAYYGRSLLGMDYMAWLWRFSEPEVGLGPGWRTELTAAAATLGQRLGLPNWDPRVGRMVFATDSFPVPGAPVEMAGGASARSYLTWLGADTRTVTEVRDRLDADQPERTALLYRLLRHGLLLEWAAAAARVQQRAGLPPESREPELIDILPNDTTQTIWRQYERTRSWVPSGPAERLDAYVARTAATDPLVTDLNEFRVAVRALADLDRPTLERLMAGALDIASHRLDAWITSFATRRLAWLRYPDATPRSTGALVGGYGWLEDLTPRGQPVDAGAVADETGTIWKDPQSAGFIHAPSLPQATTAAVLRGGHKAYAQGGSSPFAIDLRSHRVQLAEWLLDGVRQGQPLGALLGYRFERSLQQHPRVGLPRFLPALRARFPRRATGLSVEDGTQETIRSFDVVDGLALQRAWAAGSLDLARDLGVSDATDRAAMGDVLAVLDEAVDAVHDALLAEGVHHVVQGNPLRAGATLDAADRGEAPPPDLDVARTPRRGVSVTHRLLVLLDSVDPAPTGWPVNPITQSRAAAEPRLNAWLARLLPAPARVHCRFEAVNAAGGAVIRDDVTLGGLGLSPLDLLYLPEKEPDATRSELELRIEGVVHGRVDVGPNAQVRLDLTARPAIAAAVSVAELLEMLRQIRSLLDASRPLVPRDVTRPETAVDPPVSDTELATRATNAVTALNNAIADVTSGRDDGTVEQGLLRAAHLGVPGALPDAGFQASPPAPGNGSAANGGLDAHAAVVAAELTRRFEAVTALDHARSKNEISQVDYDTGRIQAVFGAGFRVITAFPTPDPATLTAALAASTSTQGGDRFAAAGLVQRVARVRRGADRLLGALSYAEALGTGDSLRIEVAQLPYTPGERWLGLPLTAPLKGDRVSLLVHAPTGVGGSGTLLAGLAVDEWVEVIPAPTETTGVALHYDAPGATAPQAILVAVNPDARARWSSELVEATLAETLSLAELRMVDLEALHPSDPDALTDIGQLLPAAHLATNVANGDAVATDLTRGA